MSILDVILYPNDILRKKSVDINKNEIGFIEKKLFVDMFETMYFYKGIGLAAIQVGIPKRMLIVDIGNNHPIKLINPNIIAKKGIMAVKEGCLSVPGKNAKIERSEQIVVKALNEEAKEVKFLFSGLEAVAIQHEIDHLDGKIILDYGG